MKTKFKALTFFFLLAVFIVLVLIPVKTDAVTVLPGKFYLREGGGFVCACPNTANNCSCALVDITPH